MANTFEKTILKKVIKRDGKKVEFDGTKIALAIKKGFDSIIVDETLSQKYNQEDVNKVYEKVLEKIEKKQGEKIKIEEL